MTTKVTTGGTKQLKFAVSIGIILVSLAWLSYGGIQETKTYYVTVPELQASRDNHQRRYRVAGTVVAGSIRRAAHRVEFQLQEAGKTLPIVYIGTEPLPDTLTDGSQAVADGRYQQDGTFNAQMVQAKCASKYEAAAARAQSGPETEQ
jgi:cytochrome c-type biogenesis protein CcmE